MEDNVCYGPASNRTQPAQEPLYDAVLEREFRTGVNTANGGPNSKFYPITYKGSR